MRKEHPILYSTPMVVAKLAGRKTQTRRVKGLEQINGSPNDWGPFGKPGDLFWGRETFYHEKYFNGLHENCFIKYKADYGNEPVGWNWKPSIFMPKEAARIWEEVVEIRVERLQDISEEASGMQLATQGRLYKHYTEYQVGIFGTGLRPIESYATLWESINGSGSWDMNPWVLVIETKILSLTGRP